MKIKKLTQVVIATLLSSGVHAETLTFHGQEQALEYISNQLPAPGQSSNDNVLRKKARLVLHNPNSFKVNLRISSQQAFAGPNNNVSFDTPAAETITINANSRYTFEPYPNDISTQIPDAIHSYNNAAKMCDLDMYTVMTSALNIVDTSTSFLVCTGKDVVIKVSWQDSLLRNSDSSIKSVSSITGTLGYYHQFDETFIDGSVQN